MDTINVKEIIGGTQSEDSVVAKNLCNVRLEKRIAQFKVGKGNEGKLILGIFPKDGNNLVVECENLEELKQIANKVILNANKKIVEGKQVSIETSLEGKENKRVRISGMGIPFDAEYQMEIQKYDEEIYELYNSEAKDDNEEIERISKESDIVSNRVSVHYTSKRRLVGDTDTGRALKERIGELRQLLDAYRKGIIKEKK